MLKNWNRQQVPEIEELEKRLDAARNELEICQLAIKEKKLPVLVLFEGWGAAGKGSCIGKVIRHIDPRFFKVVTMDKATEEEERKPFLYRYFVQIPEAGKFTFMNSGWMAETVRDCIEGRLDANAYEDRITSIRRFERSLTDNGYLVMKYFFNIDRKEQKKRLDNLEDDKNTKWRVEKDDWRENKHYAEYEAVFDNYMQATDHSTAPWHVIDAANKKWAELQVLELLVDGIHTALQNTSIAVPLLQNVFPLQPIPLLKDIDLDKSLTDEEYRTELKRCQSRLRELHNEVYRRKIPVVIAYEGWDAAGKGGNIRRITGALDPRGFEVMPIASPEPHEKARHYLWRFWTRLPKTGHINIFDRTWYGRVMVERLEGFCSENDWKRAYHEINEFERELTDWGAVVIKFWVHVDKDTQLARFTDRQNTPEKQWKITDEDWRNREKWDVYEEAINEMLQKTNTENAPWYILESNDKKYARVKALQIVIATLEKAVAERKQKDKDKEKD